MRHPWSIVSACVTATVITAITPQVAQALPHVLPLPANAKAGVVVTGSETDGVLQLKMTLDEKAIGAKIASVRLSVTDQIEGGKFREIVDLQIGVSTDKAGKLVAHFSLQRKLAAAASIALVLQQETDVPGGTWYTFTLDDHVDLFNDLPDWKLRQKLRQYASTAPARGPGLELRPDDIMKLEKLAPIIRPRLEQPKPIQPGAGLIGSTSIDGKDIGLVFHYEHGKVLQHDVLEKHVAIKADALPLPARGVEVVLQGELQVSRPMTVRARQAGGSVSHGVHTLYVGGSELGSVGDDRQKSAIYELKLEKGTHAVKWVLTGGRFGNNLLRFEDPDTGQLLPLSFSRTHLKGIETVAATDAVRISAEERGWPIPQGW